MPRTSVNVPRTVVTIMCLAEKRTSVWAGSIANVAMGWFLLRGAVTGPSPLLLTTQPYRDIVAMSTNRPPSTEVVASSHDRHRAGGSTAVRPRPATRPVASVPARPCPGRPTLDEELRAEHDISFAEYDALLTIAQAPGRRIRMGQLADEVLLSKSGVTRLIDRLVGDGLVERSACLADARGAEAVLTERGLTRLRAASRTHLRGISEHFLAVVDPADLEAARADDDGRRAARRPRRGTVPSTVLRATSTGSSRAPSTPADRRVPGRLYVGTSGFAYPGWIPRFYPTGLRASGFLAHYASRLPAVELNNTYYASPTATKVAAWVDATPDHFRFAVKAQRGGSFRALQADPARGRAVADRAVPGVRGAARDRPLPRPRRRPARRRASWPPCSRCGRPTCP